ncbi:hypothetical protein AMIS_36270 [Actinoplanes missouriensis 431]|uniref:Uncharacterized protein n=1 Tax=Actinoplanes missouriensis (strain ATCC 14538 / DSM 43046 / CBS 188.64 / JCM 3121 / NBRC 102363 / NCIMB 12654 / NRRL B-3342 / UNCC 431) TaxID=512565 RepID=I0H760_ACTM4|nr:hypothetical protein [Actinoplanes missouriensis]BAL88847.1 hypothetical protein AMIS_36270 [Actinoplanes missouriensis 431]
MAEDQRLLRIRPYYWGAIYLNDADCEEDFDIDFHDGGGPVLATASHVSVLVVNARTVDKADADVTVDVRVAPQRIDGLSHEVAFQLPSGRLYIGDADDSDEIAVQSGRWLLQFDVDDPAQARHVRLVMSPL